MGHRPSCVLADRGLGARRGAERLSASTIECAGNYHTTAIAGRLFAEELLDKSSGAGCFNPEDLFDLGDFQAELNELGVTITRT